MNRQANPTRAADATLETLFDRIKPHLALNKARLRCFAMLVHAVIGQRTVSLTWLSQHPVTGAKSESVLRRFERFFAEVVLRPRQIGALILALAPRPPQGWILAMDRTNWQFGKTHINILVVTVILGKVGLPIAWRVLPKSTKRGNSRKTHRIALMEEVLSILPVEDIRVLTMDREFVGKHWLGWLELMELRYIVRVKSNTLVGGRSAGWLSRRGRWKRHGKDLHEVFGRQVYFAAKRVPKGRDPYLAVVSHGFHGTEALELYRLRWGIETFFSHLKKRGYQFEDTHMTKSERIEKLMGVLAVAFAMSYRWGRHLEKTRGTKTKKHGHRAKSIFRQGFESLHRMLKAPSRFSDQIKEFFTQVFRPPSLQIFVGLFRGICVDFRAFEAGRGAVLGAVKPPGGIKIAGFPAGAG